MDLLLRIKDASPEEISRGVAAAEGILNRAGIAACQAQIWSDAEDAALEACCAGWTDDKKPVTSVMELLEVSLVS